MSNAQSHKVPTWSIGDRLRKSRETAGIGVADMARRLGVSRNTIGNYESGRRAVSIDAVNRYASVTGVDAAWLFTGDEHHDCDDTAHAA